MPTSEMELKHKIERLESQLASWQRVFYQVVAAKQSVVAKLEEAEAKLKEQEDIAEHETNWIGDLLAENDGLTTKLQRLGDLLSLLDDNEDLNEDATDILVKIHMIFDEITT